MNGAGAWAGLPTITIHGPWAGPIVETSLTGLWRVGGELVLADVPEPVRAAVRDLPAADTLPEALPGGSMPLQAILGQLRAGDPGVIALSHAPLEGDDLALLEACLGRGPILAEVPGYGGCRVEATGIRRVWRVRHFNRDGTQLVDSLEIADAPQALCATAEDLAETRARLDQEMAP